MIDSTRSFFCKESHLICSSLACFYHIFQCAHAVQPAYKSSSQYTGSTWFIWWETQNFPIRKVTILSSMFLPSILSKYSSIPQDFFLSGKWFGILSRACYYKCFFHLMHTCRQPTRTRPVSICREVTWMLIFDIILSPIFYCRLSRQAGHSMMMWG